MFTLLEVLQIWSIKQTRSVSQCLFTDFCVQHVHTSRLWCVNILIINIFYTLNIILDLPLQIVSFVASTPPDLYCGNFPAPVFFFFFTMTPGQRNAGTSLKFRAHATSMQVGKVGLLTTEDLAHRFVQIYCTGCTIVLKPIVPLCVKIFHIRNLV